MHTTAERRSVPVNDRKPSPTPIGRLEPNKFAPPAVYLTGDSAAVVVGQALYIDGGVLTTGSKQSVRETINSSPACIRRAG